MRVWYGMVGNALWCQLSGVRETTSPTQNYHSRLTFWIEIPYHPSKLGASFEAVFGVRLCWGGEYTYCLDDQPLMITK